MNDKIIDGKKVSQQKREEIAKLVEELKLKNIEPGLVVVLVGDDPASAIYVRNKEKSAKNSECIQKRFGWKHPLARKNC